MWRLLGVDEWNQVTNTFYKSDIYTNQKENRINLEFRKTKLICNGNMSEQSVQIPTYLKLWFLLCYWWCSLCLDILSTRRSI